MPDTPVRQVLTVSLGSSGPICPGDTIQIKLQVEPKGSMGRVTLGCAVFKTPPGPVEFKHTKTVSVEIEQRVGSFPLNVFCDWGRSEDSLSELVVEPFRIELVEVKPKPPYYVSDTPSLKVRVMPKKAPRDLQAEVSLSGLDPEVRDVRTNHVVSLRESTQLVLRFPSDLGHYVLRLKVPEGEALAVIGSPSAMLVEVPAVAAWKDEHGKSATQLKKKGYDCSALYRGGYSVADLKAAKFGPGDFRAAGCQIAEIKEAGYSAKNLKAAAYDARELRTGRWAGDLRRLSDQHLAAQQESLAEGGVFAEFTFPLATGLTEAVYSAEEIHDAGFPFAEARAAGFTTAELRDAGYTIPERGLELDHEANQVGLDRIKAIRDEFVDATLDLYSHRRVKKAWKQESKSYKSWYQRLTLSTLEAQIKSELAQLEREPAPKGTSQKEARDRRIATLKTDLEAVEGLKEAKEAKVATYKDKKHQLVGLIDDRISFLRSQRSDLEGRLGGEVGVLQKLVQDREKGLSKVNDALNALAYPRRLEEVALKERYDELLAQRQRLLGPDIATLTEPELAAIARTRPSSAQQDGLLVIERQLRDLTWALGMYEAEIEGLQQIKHLTDQVHRQWSMVTTIEAWYPGLLRKAEDVTNYVLGFSYVESLSKRFRKNITGSKQFTIQVGISAGPDVPWGGAAKLGVAIAFSSGLRVDDDRRVRSTTTIKLVPSAELSFGPKNKPLFSIAAKLGFTLSSRTHAFVDEKHYAYYFSFRIANLLRLCNRFTKYGNTWTGNNYNQFFQLYDDDLKQILKAMVGEENYDELEYYLSLPVIKVHMPLKGKFIPEADLGFEEGVTGAGIKAGGKASLSLAVFQKTALDLSDPAHPSFVSYSRQGKTLARSIAASGTVYAPLSLELTRTTISSNANPDNDGEYFNVKWSAIGQGATLTGPSGVPLFGDGEAVTGATSFVEQVKSIKLGDVVKQVFGEGAPDVTLKPDRQVYMEHNFVEVDGKYRLQYRRVSYKKSSELGITIPTGEGFNVEIGIAWEKTLGLTEHLGTNTLTYLMTVYNGLIHRKDGEDQWEAYCTLHKRQLWQVFKKVGRGEDSNVRSEAQGIDEENTANASWWGEDSDASPALPAPDVAVIYEADQIGYDGPNAWIDSLSDQQVGAATEALLNVRLLQVLDREGHQHVQPDKWLTDELLNWAVGQVLELSGVTGASGPRIHWVEPAVVRVEGQLQTRLRDDPRVGGAAGCLDTAQADALYDAILFPINSGSHWSLLVHFKAEARLYHFDSLVGSDAHDAAAHRVVDHLRDAGFLSEPHQDDALADASLVPRQEESDNCGVFLLLLVRKIKERIAAGQLGLPVRGHLTGITSAAADDYRQELLDGLRAELLPAEEDDVAAVGGGVAPAPAPAETRRSTFVADCEAGLAAIDVEPEPVDWSKPRRIASRALTKVRLRTRWQAFKDNPAAQTKFDELRDSLTLALARARQVRAHKQASLWKRHRSYLIPFDGKLVVPVDYMTSSDARRRVPVVRVPPRLEHISPADVWRDSALRDAASLAPFYREHFKIVLCLQAPEGGTLTFATRRPDGPADLKYTLERLFRGLFAAEGNAKSKLHVRQLGSWRAGKPKLKIHQLRCFLRLHGALYSKFQSWYDAKVRDVAAESLTGDALEDTIQEMHDLYDAWEADPTGDGQAGDRDAFEVLLEGLEGPFSSFTVGSWEERTRWIRRWKRRYR